MEEKCGFQLPDNPVYRNFEKIYHPVRERRLKRWNDLLKENGSNFTHAGGWSL